MDLERQKHIQCLFAAELQFRLASAVDLAVVIGNQPLEQPATWIHGNHKVKHQEIALRKDQAEVAADILINTATYLLAVAMKDAIYAVISDPYNHTDPDIQGAYQISRLIRNSFAHAPFMPTWSIDPGCRNKIFSVKDILQLETADLQGKPFDWRHYGGPLALLRLCHYVRFEILKDTAKRPSEREIDNPENIYIQQGNLILKRLNP